MRKNEKQPTYCFRLDAHLVEKLDKRIARAGYTSRSEFFTAVAYIVLYGIESVKQLKTEETREDEEKLPKPVTTWIRETIPPITEEEILSGLHFVIADMLFAAIAMKGVDVVYENTWGDVRRVFHERYGVWVTESDVREGFVSFAAVHARDLAEYRENQLRCEDE